jgi:hypothetical protein
MMSQLRLYHLLLLTCLLAITPSHGFNSLTSKKIGKRNVGLQEQQEGSNHYPPITTTSISRRSAFVFIGGLLPVLTSASQVCNAGFFGGGDENRRELALCLVNLLRLQYWAENMSSDLTEHQDEEERSKKLYLEARLGAKAAVTNKIGGGATNRVYNIGALKFRETMDDLTWHVSSKGASKNKKEALQRIEDLIESLASLVEFDGLETTQDPSPRSTLMLSMYDRKKLAFVQRMLAERIIPTAQSLFDDFDPNVREVSLNYVQSTYTNEIPPSKKKPEVPIDASETTAT